MDAPEFTPTKLNFSATTPHRPRASRAAATTTNGSHPGVTARAMENRLWSSEDLSEEMSFYNHWILASSTECGIILTLVETRICLTTKLLRRRPLCE